MKDGVTDVKEVQEVKDMEVKDMEVKDVEVKQGSEGRR